MSVNARFEEIQADLSVEDLKAIWAGWDVVLLLGDGRVAAIMSAGHHVVKKIKVWCVKNNYRCSAIRNGLIYL